MTGEPLLRLDRERVWAAQTTKHFIAEMLRLVRAYEKAHPPIKSLTITARGKTGRPLGVDIATEELPVQAEELPTEEANVASEANGGALNER